MTVLVECGAILVTLFVEKVLGPDSGANFEGQTDEVLATGIILLKVILDIPQIPQRTGFDGKFGHFTLPGPLDGGEDAARLADEVFNQGELFKFAQVSALFESQILLDLAIVDRKVFFPRTFEGDGVGGVNQIQTGRTQIEGGERRFGRLAF